MSLKSFKRLYVQEVLGCDSYICPPQVHKLRQIKGPWRGAGGNSVLTVSLENLSPSQENLLKKIMSSIGLEEYSLLHIKETGLLSELFDPANRPADFVFVFGLNDSSYTIPDYCFYTNYRLQELEGTSLEVRNKKQDLWQELKKWKEKTVNLFV